MTLGAEVHEKTESFIHGHSEKKLAMFLVIGAEAVMFASLFAVYFVMVGHQKNGPSPSEFLDVKKVIIPTILLLLSSVTCYFAVPTLVANEPTKTLFYLAGTLLLALGFLGFEVNEFISDALKGHTLSTSPYLSSFYLLVGMHGCHVLFGSLWMVFLFLHIFRKKSTTANKNRLAAFSIYWHFVDTVWVFIFLLVYLLGEFL